MDATTDQQAKDIAELLEQEMPTSEKEIIDVEKESPMNTDANMNTVDSVIDNISDEDSSHARFFTLLPTPYGI
jgi:hypothetical protein